MSLLKDLMTWLPESWQGALGDSPETIAKLRALRREIASLELRALKAEKDAALLRARLDYTFQGSLSGIQEEALRIATEHGFTDATPAEDIALIHSELSEALEDIRSGKPMVDFWFDGPDRKPCGVPIELADVVLRIAHFCGKHKINLTTAVLVKMAYNNGRPFKHGKKF